MQLQTRQQNAFSVVRIKKMQNELPQTINLLFISENRKRNKTKRKIYFCSLSILIHAILDNAVDIPRLMKFLSLRNSF
jgi:hypothetical protein